MEGFQDTSINAIPFQASVDVNTATIDVSLRHQIGVGFYFDVFGTGAEAGVYLDLPRYRAEFTRVQGVDENCTALASSRSEDKEIAQRVLDNVYSIKPTVKWQAGLAGEATVCLDVRPTFDIIILTMLQASHYRL